MVEVKVGLLQLLHYSCVNSSEIAQLMNLLRNNSTNCTHHTVLTGVVSLNLHVLILNQIKFRNQQPLSCIVRFFTLLLYSNYIYSGTLLEINAQNISLSSCVLCHAWLKTLIVLRLYHITSPQLCFRAQVGLPGAFRTKRDVLLFKKKSALWNVGCGQEAMPVNSVIRIYTQMSLIQHQLKKEKNRH